MQAITVFKQLLKKFGLEYFGKYYGLYRGVVESVDDPEYRGRLKLKVPQIYGNDVPNFWAPSRGMFTGNNIGFYALPQKGDAVWVTFENGNPRFPVWEYGWYAKNETPEEARQKNVYIFQTSQNQRIYINDNDKFIRIISADGIVVEVNEGISLGSKTISAEPAVLGNKNNIVHNTVLSLIEAMNAYIAAFSAAQIATASTIPLYAPMIQNWTVLQTASATLQTAITNAKTTVPQTLSKVVTLD